jgi:hypothetical protein
MLLLRIYIFALGVSVAFAQRWPMVSVNAQGEIILQSLTRAQQFQLTPIPVVSSSRTDSANAAPIGAGWSAVDLTVSLSGEGVSLPVPSLGAKISIFQKASVILSYTLWSPNTSSYFINADSGTVSLVVSTSTRRVECVCVSLSRWNCAEDTAGVTTTTASSILKVTTSTSTAVSTLTAANIIGGLHTATPTAAYTITLDSSANLISAAGTSASLTDSYPLTIINNGAETAAGVSLLVTIASTDITIPTSNVIRIAPGQSRSFLIYRTSSSTYRMIQLSSFRTLSALDDCGFLVLPTTASNPTLLTCNDSRFFMAVGTSAAIRAAQFKISNAMHLLGRQCPSCPSAEEI